MRDPAPRRAPRELVRFLVLTCGSAVGLVVLAAVVWPPTVTGTSLALMVLFAVAEAHPVQLRSRAAESIVVSELAVALALGTLPLGEAVWVVAGGAVLAAPAVATIGVHERLRTAPLARHLANFAKNVLGGAALVLVVAFARPSDEVGVWVAVAVGLLLNAAVTHLVVRAAIRRAEGAAGPLFPWRDTRAVGGVALLLAVLTVPLGLQLRSTSSAWSVALLLTLALVLVARARMGREASSYRLTIVTSAIDRLGAAEDLADFDARLVAVIRDALEAGRVEYPVASPGPARRRDRVAARIEEDGPFAVATEPRSRAPWTRPDEELLEAVLTAAGPIRRRLLLVARVTESERFASLVLTAAGHDVANQLQVARSVTDTLATRLELLPAGTREDLLDRAGAAMDRAARSLRDMVVLGATGPGASCRAGDLALFCRRLGSDVRVVAQNVWIGGSATLVERAVENLVTNARRHHTGPGPLEVHVLRADVDVAIEVRDRGPGLDPSQLHQLFRPFTQLHDADRRRGSLGVGLYIARGLAESAGGSLTYHDREGGGAVFTLRLPSGDPERAPERGQERVVLGACADRDAQAAPETRLRREVAYEHAVRQ